VIAAPPSLPGAAHAYATVPSPVPVDVGVPGATWFTRRPFTTTQPVGSEAGVPTNPEAVIPANVAPANRAPPTRTPVRFAPVRSAPVRFTNRRSAPVRLTPRRSQPCRSAPGRMITAETPAQSPHALCNAHVLRELQAVTDHNPPGQAWCWAQQTADALVDLKNLADVALATNPANLAALDADALAEALARYRCGVHIGLAATAARATKPQAERNTLARRLIKRETDYLRFTTNPLVSLDNNAAEREIRMIKLRQKVSGCLRTRTGAEQFCAIRSYLATAGKHDIGLFQALTVLAERKPWMPATA